MTPIDILVIVTLIIAVGVLVAVMTRFLRRPFMESLSLVTLAISIPKNEREEKSNLIEEINKSEKLFDALAALKQPFVFELSVHNTGEAINFYLVVPRGNVDFTTRQVQGLFPEAQVYSSPDYTIFSPDGATAVASLALKAKAVLPIRTYREAEVDTFAPVVSTFSHLNDLGEGASFQLVVKPAGEAARKAVVESIAKLKKGEKLADVISTKFFSAKEISNFFDLSSSGKKDNKEPKPVDEEAVKALNQKVAKPLFLVNARLVASAGTRDQAEDILLSMAGAFSQFAAPLRNNFQIIRPKNIKKLVFSFIFREFDTSSAITLNSEELASLFHLPTATTDVPRIAWQKAHEAAPPANLPNEGVLVGESIFRGEKRGVRLLPDDRRRHLYVVGQTGTGKSYLMLNMAVQDMQAGKGLAIIDPHGELVEKVLGLVPPNRIDDVIVFNPVTSLGLWV